MHGTKQTPTVDREITETYRGLTLAIKATADGGYTISATSGPTVHGALTESFTDLDDARGYWRDIKNLALDGQTAHQIAVKLGRADSSPEWTAPATQVEPAARIADLYGVRRTQVRPTMAGAHLTPLSAPQQAALNSAVNGQVSLQPGISRPTLTALVRKGYGEAVYQAGLGRRKVIKAVRLFNGALAAA